MSRKRRACSDSKALVIMRKELTDSEEREREGERMRKMLIIGREGEKRMREMLTSGSSESHQPMNASGARVGPPPGAMELLPHGVQRRVL